MTEPQSVWRATDPQGRSFAIFMGAPGSALDADYQGYSAVALFFNVVAAFFRSTSNSWRLAVQPLSKDGRLGRIALRERFDSQADCVARAEALVAEIARGEHASCAGGKAGEAVVLRCLLRLGTELVGVH